MLSTIINFSTNEKIFLRHCVEEALLFSQEVIVVVCDHFFDGSPEDFSLLKSIYSAHPEVTFIEYPYSKENFYANHSPHFWHDLSRLIGMHFVSGEYLLFLDVDEIVEGQAFANWLETFPLDEFSALRLSNYWYFREACYRAKALEDTPLLVSKKALSHEVIMHPEERAGTFATIQGKKMRFAMEQAPCIHHYSWVRNKEAMLKKVVAWGHRSERDWKALVEEEFSRPFSGKDFVHGYTFQKVKSTLRVAEYEPAEKLPTNVIQLSTRDVHKIDLSLTFFHD